MKRIKENSGYPKKIVVAGSHHVGKTTLCKELLEHFRQRGFKVEMLGEVARESPYLVNEKATLKAQNWILEEQKKMEKELTGKSGAHILLLDRGLIDNFAYWLRAARNNNASEDLIKEREREVFKHSSQYNAILFIQPFDGEKVEDNGFRSIDIEWIKEMHDAVYNIITQFSRSFLVQRIKVLLRNRGFLIQGIKALLRDRRFLIQRIKVLLRKSRYDVPVFLLAGSEKEVFEQAKKIIETHLLLG